MTANTYGRQVVIPVTNKSGGQVIAGDVVIFDSANNLSFTTTTSAGVTTPIGIAQATIANNTIGPVLVEGYAALVNVNASVTRLQYGKTHTVAKQAAASASRVAGTFCTFLTSSATPDALVYPVDLAGAALTNPMTNVGDIIYGGTAGAPTRLADVATGSSLISGGVNTAPAWGYPTLTVSENFLTGDVAMTNTNTFYDGPTLTPAAGTYVFWGAVLLHTASAGTFCMAKLWDGTTVYDGRDNYLATSGGNIVIPVFGTVAVNGSTAIKISAAQNSASGIIRATADTNATGATNKASHLMALRIA